nr:MULTISPECIES: suppressor of fused domain protein [Rhizobium]
MTLASSAAPDRPATSACNGRNGETATMPGAEKTSLNSYRRTMIGVRKNDPVEILTVNLISGSEYRFIKEKGLNAFLDMLDEEDHPPIFDPKRKSYL